MAGRTTDNLDDDYANAGFGGTIGFGKKPALLVIDFVMAYLVKNSPLYAGVEEELKVNEALVQAARANKVPVIWTNVVYTAGGAAGGIFYRKVDALKCFDAGNPLGDFPPSLQPRDDELVISKQYPSAFFGTPLAPTLTAQGIDTLILTGLSTSGCVRASTLDAMQYGFIPVVARDGAGDRDINVHEANLFDLQAKYADVLPAADIIAYMEGLDR